MMLFHEAETVSHSLACLQNFSIAFPSFTVAALMFLLLIGGRAGPQGSWAKAEQPQESIRLRLAADSPVITSPTTATF